MISEIGYVVGLYPANTKHLYNICTMLDQRQRRWAGVVQMLYKMFCVCWVAVSNNNRQKN